MKTKNLLLIVALCLATSIHAQSQRERIRLSDGWKFAFGDASSPEKDFGCGTEYFNYLTKANSIHNEGPYATKFDDSAWKEVRVPHDWVTTLPFDPQASHSHGYKTVGYRYPQTSVGWYRNKIKIDEADRGKHISLQFDGIFRDARVWFNGFYLGNEPSGYATQVYDVTEYVNFGGDNLICVRADATLEEGWFYEGAGIYRDVWLNKDAMVHVSPFGTFVYTDKDMSDDACRVTVETELDNSSLEQRRCAVLQRIIDADGNEVGRSNTSEAVIRSKETVKVVQQVTVTRPHLWSPDSPYLYKVITEVRENGAMTDEYVTTTGLRTVEFTADKGFLLNGKPLKLKGVNVHQDHAGVGSAIPDALQAYRIKQLKSIGCNAYRTSHNPPTPALLDVCDREGVMVIDETRLSGINKDQLRLLEIMVRRDRNHPSVILWSDGNEEWGYENTEQGTRIAESMREYTRLLDPTRHSTIANAGGSEMIKGLDVVGYNYILQNNVLERRRQHPEWKIVGTEETTGAGTRGVYFNSPEFPGRMASLNRTGHQDRENIIENGWQFYSDNPWTAGVFYWTGFDYRGEPNPLKYPAVVSEFGILDYCGFPKDEAWYLRSWWTSEPTLHVFPHWNLKGHEGETVEVWAYSNCEEVELFVNGKSAGRQQMPRNGHLKWNVTYRPGALKAVGYNGGKRVMTEVVETTADASRIVLTADRNTIAADGNDVSVITVTLKDKKGRTVPDACNDITISLSGNARIIGVGNGDPSCLDADNSGALDCHSFRVKAFNGLAQIIVQGGKTAGSAVVTCSGDGLSSCDLKLEIR